MSATDKPGKKDGPVERPSSDRASRVKNSGGRTAPAAGRLGETDPSGQETFPVVGIGASAGGLDAFKKFLSAVPTDSGMGFVLIQHLDPAHRSLTAELLAKDTTMKVAEVKDQMPVEVNRVYVIPPNKYLAIRDGILHLSAPITDRGMRMPIDFFFRSLSESQDEKAIGIILSGTGSDGTFGLKAIKGHGGLAIAQTPDTAQYDGMPRSAIATGIVDYVLPIQEMPRMLVHYVQHSYIKDGVKPEEFPEKAPEHLLHSILAALSTQAKFDFRCYKKGTLMRRIRRRMGLNHIEELAEYLNLLRETPDEVKRLVKDLLIGVTGFFRDPEAFEVLEKEVIPKLVAAKSTDAPIRVWVPGCATGEEPYSIAMLLIEQLEAAQKHCKLQVFATEINEDALGSARQGVYPENIAVEMSPKRLRQFFNKKEEEQTYQVGKELRESVVFAIQNLFTDPPFSHLDLISCRNLLIYIETDVQRKAISLFHFALNAGGYLFLGNAENIGQYGELFEPISKKWRVYRRCEGTRPGVVDYPIVSGQHDVRGTGTVTQPLLSARGGLGKLTQQLLCQAYAPAAVLINRTHQILYFHGPTDRYLNLPSGEATHDLIAMAREGLRARLRAVVSKAIQNDQPATAQIACIRDSGIPLPVKVTVHPVKAREAPEGLLLVSFEDEPEPPDPTGVGRSDSSGPGESHVSQLEYELKSTKADLQSIIEELETTNEELKASNEEAMSMNEELQSTNEEMSTVNSQLQSKMEELETTNNDLSNLLSSTDIATLFLDTQFRIKRFSSVTTRLFNLISTDVGRPISHISKNFNDADMLRDAKFVLDKLTPREKALRTHDGHWYMLRMAPYRTQDNRIDGVVLNFIDITERQRAHQLVHEAQLYAESIVETVREPLLVLDGQLRVVSANRSFYETFQITKEETEKCRLYELGDHQWDIVELRTLLEQVLPKETDVQGYEVEHEFPKIGIKKMLLNARRLEEQSDRAPLILVAITDITEAKQAELALQSSESRFHALYDDNPSMYFNVNAEGIVLSVNKFGAGQLGYAVEELMGDSVFNILEDDKLAARDLLAACLQDPGSVHRRDIHIRRKDGVALWARGTARAVSGPDGKPVVLVVCEDITEARKLAEQVSYHASHDALTGLENRREFEHRLERVLETANIAETEHALCYMDLDDFKVINDSCGHLAGDELLRQLAGVLREHVRKRDTVARLGGDEFGILMEHCGLREAQRVADGLRQAVENYQFLWHDRTFTIGVSIGLVPITAPSGSITDILRAADSACYAAKDAGRNRIHLYHEQDAELAQRRGEMQWVSQIQRALEEGRFRLNFQSIVPVKGGGEGAHYELLLRMEDEEGRLVLPAAFLPAAERYHLAAKLDRWVIQTAFEWLTSHPEQLARLSVCAINLSGHSLGNPEILDFISGRVSAGRPPADKICFEITETAAIANLALATDFMKTLKEQGCQFALDDFGSGLSSFAYLKNLRVDFLKIDGAFVREMVHDPIALAIVKSINEIGQVMGMKTIAEYVENDAILAKLRELGVDYAQGYGIDQPQPLVTWN